MRRIGRKGSGTGSLHLRVRTVDHEEAVHQCPSPCGGGGCGGVSLSLAMKLS